MDDIKDHMIKLPLVPLRDMIVFPNTALFFDIGRDKSISALEQAMIDEQEILLAAQKDANIEEPNTEDIYDIGTITKVKQIVKLPGDVIRVLVEGVERGKIVEYTQDDPYFEVRVKRESSMKEIGDELEQEALMRSILDMFGRYVKLSDRVSPETYFAVKTIDDPGDLADIIAANVLVKTEDRQKILNSLEAKERLENLYSILSVEIEILEIEEGIAKRMKEQIESVQKEYYLKEQLKAIQKELGEYDTISGEVDSYMDQIEKAELPEEARERAMKELDRLSKMPPTSPEGSVIRTYLDWILELPWNEETVDNEDLKRAAQILDEDHYGLEEVKERVVEHLAVMQLAENMRGSILCFVGPPGVGKTSIAKSIARALDREFVRMSLGGVRDEAEIKGHRRTYIGAIPGRIISGLSQAGTKNPVFLLDEIDKMGSDFRGDPASALLEVLDKEQNFAFRDHYIDLPFDLSKVMFIMTANTLDTVPPALLDRMEVIRIAGYTEEEKMNIAIKYLIPKQLKEHGLDSDSLLISEKTIQDIINYYTRESGVRNLEREIASLCRKVARRTVEDGKRRSRISRRNLEKYLGVSKYRYDKIEKKDQVGVVTGLAWTAVGGDTLFIETVLMPGKGKLTLTGKLGDVMKESANAGHSYIRSKAEEFGIDPKFHTDTDMHIHVPEGAIPKDGPSAGITMVTAMISALTEIPVKKNVAMTGEITLRGRVLPVGGIKEKILAARRAGIDTVIIPAENEKDIEEISENIRGDMKIIKVQNMDEVLKWALVTTPKLRM